MDEILRLEQVSFAYELGDEQQQALSDCSLSICAGEKIAVLGNNGAGKSTFFLLANGVLQPQSGRIFFEGRQVDRSTASLNARRRGVGVVFQDPDVQILGATVEQEISFGPMNLDWPRQQVEQCVAETIQKLHLEQYRRRVPQYLSGGEKKRVSIADVLAMQPRLLLLDEPSAGLDAANLQLLEQNLQILEQQGLALVVTTHDIDFAWRWAERILIFDHGRLVADRAPEQIFSDAALLAQCGLPEPTLVWVSRALGIFPPPRTRQAFEQCVAERKGV